MQPRSEERGEIESHAAPNAWIVKLQCSRVLKNAESSARAKLVCSGPCRFNAAAF